MAIQIGDKAYGAKAIRDYITGKDAKYTIPPKSNDLITWKVDYFTYKERHLHALKYLKFLLENSIIIGGNRLRKNS